MKAPDGSEVSDETPVVVLDDPVLLMRFRRLMDAGYGFPEATEITFRKDIDLHKAEELAGSAGPVLATKILL